MTFLSILANLNIAVVWMVSTSPLLSKSFSPYTKPLVTVTTNTPITIGITVTLMFHNFFSSLARSRYLTHFWLSFSSTLWSVGKAKSTFRQVLFFFFLFWLLQGLVVWSRLGDRFVFQNPREVCVSHSSGRILGCVYTICSYGQI